MDTELGKEFSDFKDSLTDIQKKNGQLLEEYNALLNEFNKHDYVKENKKFGETIAQLSKELSFLKKNIETLSRENSELKCLINEYVVQDKIKILNNSKAKLDLYFGRNIEKTTNKLELFERTVKKKIDKFNAAVSNDINKELNDFIIQHNELVNKVKICTEKCKYALTEKIGTEYNADMDQSMSKEKILEYVKRHSFELNLGSNWINKIGILFILVGVGAAFKYSYSTWFTPVVKGSSFFGLGVLFILFGEYCSRKGKTPFSLGFLGGGVAIFYISCFFCYFYLGITDLKTALFLTLIATVIAIFLSLKHQSQTICSLGLIGGNLPVLTYFIYFPRTDSAIVAAMLYSIILNLVVLVFAFKYKWQVINYISFITSNLAMIFLSFMISCPVLGLIYSLIIFFIYIGAILMPVIAGKRACNVNDYILILLNMLISSLVVYFLAGKIVDGFAGGYALSYAVFYLVAGVASYRFLKQEKTLRLFFFSASFLFAVLFVPFQFALDWVWLGWFAEGLVFTIVGLQFKNRILELSGLCLFVLSTVLFYAIYCMAVYLYIITIEHLLCKFTAVISGECILTILYLGERRKRDFSYTARQIFDICKIAVVVTVYLYIQYIVHLIYIHFTQFAFTILKYNTHVFYDWLVYLTVLLLFASLFTELADFNTRLFYIVRTVFTGLFIILNIFVLCAYPIIYIGTSYCLLNYSGFAALVVLNILGILSIYYLLGYWKKTTVEFYKYVYIPEVLMTYIGIITLIIFFIQLKISFNDPVLTAAIVVYGLAGIYIGLSKYFVLLRRIGLSAVFIGTAKFFIIDLSLNKIEYKIISYFVFGIIFILISFIYQKAKNRFDKQLAAK